MNKIFAISSTGKTEKSILDLRFGKCENVVIFNLGDNSLSIIENPYKNTENSGTQLVKFLKDQNVSAIITGEVGPKVSSALEKEKLQLILSCVIGYLAGSATGANLFRLSTGKTEKLLLLKMRIFRLNCQTWKNTNLVKQENRLWRMLRSG